MKENDTLYDLLTKKVKYNVENADKIEYEKRKTSIDQQYHEAKIRDRYNVSQMKAYYYYKYFIIDILPMLIKERIKNNYALTMEGAKQKKFDYKFQVLNYSNGNTQFEKNGNVLLISFDDYAIYKEFIDYLNAFGLRNNIRISYEYLRGQVYYFNYITLGDIINAYYSERQGLEFTDELIASIQEEENTNVNGEELTKKFMKR